MEGISRKRKETRGFADGSIANADSLDILHVWRE
jgi:hypothetical protein